MQKFYTKEQLETYSTKRLVSLYSKIFDIERSNDRDLQLMMILDTLGRRDFSTVSEAIKSVRIQLDETRLEFNRVKSEYESSRRNLERVVRKYRVLHHRFLG